MLEFFKHIDTELFLLINGIHNPFFDQLMQWVSRTLFWLPLYAILIFFLIRMKKWQSIITLLFIALLITLSDQCSTLLFKDMFHRLRPCYNPDIQNFVHLVNNYCGGLYGFVSSHAANTFAAAIFLSLTFRGKYTMIALLCWASLVSYSRVYLGLHYPGDVIGGAILGSLLAIMLFYIQLFILNRLKKENLPKS